MGDVPEKAEPAARRPFADGLDFDGRQAAPF
jgi:hypothetical protein